MATFTFGKTELAARRKATMGAFGFMCIGLAVGAIAGLLTAPKSGKQLRKDMGRKLDDARDAMNKLGEQAEELWERGGELAEAAVKKAEPVARFLRRGA
jgi:gas vesicle protein